MVRVNDKLLDILACPFCKTPLKITEDRNEISCPVCRKNYRVKDQIPIFIDEKEQAKKDLLTKEGQKMSGEYRKEDFFFKILDFGKKIVTSSLVAFKPEKKWKNLLLEKKGKETMILEIGSGSRRIDKKVINFDIDAFLNVNVVGDAHYLPFLNSTFDTVWIEAVLEHVKNPQKVVSEIYRVLKPGGYVFSVIPFVHPYHGYPDDYQRFSIPGMRELFYNFKEEEIGVYRGASVALVSFISDYISLFSFSSNRKVYFVIKGLVSCVIFPLKLLDLILNKNKRSCELASSLYYLGKK